METRKRSGRKGEVMTELHSGYSNSRASRTVDRYMIAICVLFVFALCSNSYSAAAQSPNLLDQMEQDFKALTDKAISWEISQVNEDNIALIDRIELGSESACWTLEPETGYIDIYDYYLPQGQIPLCITQAWLDQFYVTVHVYGGYELLETCLWLEQKGEWYCLEIYEAYFEKICCSEYYATYKLRMVEDICFDANNWPSVSGDFKIDHGDYADLGKEIHAYFCSLWTGCSEDWQQFTISLVH